MALFAEVRRIVVGVCRTSVLWPEGPAVFKIRPSRRSSSLNREVRCIAVVPYPVRESCTLLRKHTEHVPSLQEMPDSVGGWDHPSECQDFSTVSVENFKDLVQVLPKSSEELSNIVDYICDVQQATDQLSLSASRKTDKKKMASGVGLEKYLLDGIYLDRIFDIDNQDRKRGHSPCVHDIKANFRLSELPRSTSALNEMVFGDASCTLDGGLARRTAVINKSYSSATMSSSPLVVMSEHVLFCDTGSPSTGSNQEDSRLPNRSEMELIREHLVEYMPYLFIRRHDYRIYTQDLIFENNFVENPYVTVGITPYVLYLAKCRVYAHFKYANIKMTILKATIHPEDGSVRIRWRVSGIPQIRAFMFWKFLPWRYKDAVKEESEWLDGFSTFYVQPKTGLVYKHRLDKVIPDDELVLKKEGKKLEEKLREMVAPV